MEGQKKLGHNYNAMHVTTKHPMIINGNMKGIYLEEHLQYLLTKCFSAKFALTHKM